MGFAKGDMAAPFRHGIRTGCRSLRARNSPGRRIIRDGPYRMPPITAYTGARREETADIREEEEGVTFFDIRENGNRGEDPGRAAADSAA